MPEQAFFNVGGVEQVLAKAKTARRSRRGLTWRRRCSVELVSPEQVLFAGEATMVIARTLGGGDIAFLPGHAPFLGALTENHTRIYAGRRHACWTSPCTAASSRSATTG